MPVFFYKARNERGDEVQGTKEAISEAAVVSALQEKGLIVTKVEYSAAQIHKMKDRAKLKRHKKIKTRDTLTFISDTATLLDAGIPMIRAFEMVGDQIESEVLYKILKIVSADLNAGSTLRDAILKHPKAFPPLWGHLIEAGEISGTLPAILKRLGENLDASEKLRGKVVSALIYPSVLATVAFGIIILFLVKIVPVFSSMFDSFGGELPFLTRIIIALSDFLQAYFIFLAGGVVALVFAVKAYVATTGGRRFVDRHALNLPLFGGFIQDAILAGIAINLSTLVKSGIEILKALDITARSSGNVHYEAALATVGAEVQQGRVMSASMDDNPLFSSMMVRMIKIGEDTGRLVDMLENISKYYQNRVEVFVSRLSVLIEPIILVFMGGVVGFLVVAIFLPIFSISSLIK
jgi:type IV pilus assembly protein PilC